jgi:hypothetical protein
VTALNFDVFWRDHGAKAGMRGLAADTDKSAKGFSLFKASAVAAGSAAGLAIFKFGKDSVKAYTEAQTSQNELQDAFRKFPKLADVNIGSLQKLNSALELKTKFDDDATASGQAVLANFKLTGQQITQLTPLLQDYAVKTGKDLPTAATDLGKAMLGSGRALKAVGINFKDTGTAGGNFTEIMGGLRTQVGGFAESEGKTAAGQSAILKNEFGELQESVGQKLLPALLKTGHVLLSTVGFLQANMQVVGPLTLGMAGLATAVWGVNKASAGITATKKAWESVSGVFGSISKQGNGATRSLSGFANSLGGPVTIALVAGAAALGWWMKKQADSRARVNDLKNALDQQTGALTLNARELIYNTLSSSGAIRQAKTLGISLLDLTEAAAGNGDAMARVRAVTDQYSSAASELEVRTNPANVALREQSSAAYGVMHAINGSNKEVNKARTALTDMQAAGVIATDGTARLAGATTDAAAALADEKKKASAAAAALLAHNSAALTAQGSEIGFQAAVDDATASLKTNGRTLNINTEKGRANKTALITLATSTLSWRQAVQDAGGSQKEQTKIMETGRQKLIQMATRFGMTKSAARKYADEVLGIPKRVSTTITLGLHNNIPKTLFGVTIGRGRGGTVGMATGGAVRGPGTGTSDSIPRLLSNNEHVWTAREVSAAGGHDSVKAMRNAVLGMAGGGPVFDGRLFTSGVTQIASGTSGRLAKLIQAIAVQAVGNALGGGGGGSVRPRPADLREPGGVRPPAGCLAEHHELRVPAGDDAHVHRGTVRDRGERATVLDGAPLVWVGWAGVPSRPGRCR